MKKILSLMVLFLGLFLLVGCGPEDVEVKGYGLVHKSYVGEVVLTVNPRGVVVDAKLEEYYLADHAAVVKAFDVDREDVLVANGKSYAKYFSVNGDIFIAKVVDGSVVWTHETHGELKEWVKVEKNAEAYVKAVLDDKVFVSTVDGELNDELEVIGNAAVAMTKSGSNYGGEIWDWKKAMDDVRDILVGSKVSFKDEDMVLEDNKWVIGGDITGATLIDLKDYIAVAKRAIDKANK